MTPPSPRATTIAILAMGGEGGGVLANWIVDLAENCGFYAQTTSVPGVAQRTGSTIYYVEIFPEAAVRAAGREPVLALMPAPGELDIVIASELMEAGRAVQRGLVTPDRTTLIASTHRVYSMTERTAMGDGRVDSQALLDASAAAARKFVAADFAQIARDSDSVISAVLFGALAAAGALPFSRQQFEEAMGRSGVGAGRSLAAFAAGFQQAQCPAPPTERAPQPVPARAELRDFPAASHAILAAAVPRLAEYQDEPYASEYLTRLAAIRDLEAKHGGRECRLLCETARYLALWMCYEDAIRVADLKTRRARFERVRREARPGASELLQIHEFLHPRVEEMADILPASIGRWLLGTGWASRLVGRLTGHGKIVETTSIFGFLQLYFLAGMRMWRRKSLRFQREQRKMKEWLEAICAVAPENYELAAEVAECPRLLKGYGDTHLGGSRNFDAVMQALPAVRRTDDAAGSLRKLRNAALADENGGKLAEALREFGVRVDAVRG
jgi:indolepyruvate ferredoxin oxidoreductase beta subunit